MAWLLAFMLAAMAALPAGAVAAVGAEPFSSGAVAQPASEEEQRTWSEAEELHEIILNSGVVYEDPALTAYVQGVMDRLYPEFKGAIHVTLLKSAHLNAFAVPDGDIYVNVGLLARFENEAQLATVLGHEGTHFTNRHGYLSAKSLKSNAALATFGSLLGVPVLPQLIAVSSMFGYSRELETEADEVGYLRLLQAGYDVREAPKVFEHLMREVKAEDIQEPFFFSDHPKLKERLDNMTRLSAHAVGGGDGAQREEYSRRMQHARIDALESMLSMGRAKQALIVLENEADLRELPPHALYWRGEAYRRRGEAGDTQRAEASYRGAIEAAPGFAPSYRALGIILLKDGKKAEAASNFEHYLELAPQAKDRKYVESYLRMANTPEGGKP
jgi:beta-barrel assembly-enhancing protease